MLSDPVGALNRPDLVHTGSSNIYEARTSSDLQSGLTQAVMASAASCRETQYVSRSQPWQTSEFTLICGHSKECARGAVTCGDQWIFFAYQAPKGGDYAKYARTEVLDVGKDAENLDLILGVLVDWVRRLQKRSLYSISRKPYAD